MVGPWRLELQTSTVSKPLYYVRPTTSRALEAVQERVPTSEPELLQVKLQAKKFTSRRQFAIESALHVRNGERTWTSAWMNDAVPLPDHLT
jgi:hypothetical protein